MQNQQIKIDEPQINKDRLFNRLVALCSIAGPSLKESKVAGYILNFAEERVSEGLICKMFPSESIPAGGDTSNILIRIPGTGQGDVILLSAHLDTVPLGEGGNLSVVLSDGILRAEGDSILGGDDRAGVAAALEMIDLGLMFPERHSGIEVLFTVQEEVGALGSKGLDRFLIEAEFGYNLDGETSPGSIVIRAPRKAKYICEVYGISSHAALAPEKGLSAVKIAGKIIDKLPQGQIDPDTTANIGSICGGGQTNIVPDYVKISGEVRSFTSEGFEKVSNDVEQICKSIGIESGGRTDIFWEHIYFGYSVEPSGRCINRFNKACLCIGVKPELLSSPGGGDSNNLNALGIENVVFGLGMHEIHTSNEYLVIDEFNTAVEILKELIISKED